jgi:hypothetical protein
MPMIGQIRLVLAQLLCVRVVLDWVEGPSVQAKRLMLFHELDGTAFQPPMLFALGCHHHVSGS